MQTSSKENFYQARRRKKEAYKKHRQNLRGTKSRYVERRRAIGKIREKEKVPHWTEFERHFKTLIDESTKDLTDQRTSMASYIFILSLRVLSKFFPQDVEGVIFSFLLPHPPETIERLLATYQQSGFVYRSYSTSIIPLMVSPPFGFDIRARVGLATSLVSERIGTSFHFFQDVILLFPKFKHSFRLNSDLIPLDTDHPRFDVLHSVLPSHDYVFDIFYSLLIAPNRNIGSENRAYFETKMTLLHFLKQLLSGFFIMTVHSFPVELRLTSDYYIAERPPSTFYPIKSSSLTTYPKLFIRRTRPTFFRSSPGIVDDAPSLGPPQVFSLWLPKKGALSFEDTTWVLTTMSFGTHLQEDCVVFDFQMDLDVPEGEDFPPPKVLAIRQMLWSGDFWLSRKGVGLNTFFIRELDDKPYFRELSSYAYHPIFFGMTYKFSNHITEEEFEAEHDGTGASFEEDWERLKDRLPEEGEEFELNGVTHVWDGTPISSIGNDDGSPQVPIGRAYRTRWLSQNQVTISLYSAMTAIADLDNPTPFDSWNFLFLMKLVFSL